MDVLRDLTACDFVGGVCWMEVWLLFVCRGLCVCDSGRSVSVCVCVFVTCPVYSSIHDFNCER